MTISRTLLTASLILTIACDDAERADIDENMAETARQGQEDNTEYAHRAIRTIQSVRAVSQVLRNNPLTPSNESPNCASVTSYELEELESDCDVMPESGYVVSLTDCEMAGGERFNAELLISTPDIASGDLANVNGAVDPIRVLQVAPDWMVQTEIVTENGITVSSCGYAHRGVLKNGASYTLDIDGQDGSYVSFNVETTSQNRTSQMSGRRDLIELREASHPDREIQRMTVRSNGDSEASLLPSRGVVRFEGQGAERILFRPIATENNRFVWSPNRRVRQQLDVQAY